ncbi:MAG: mRNA-degrading endonuclease [Candidatus Schekmanbacteria bacterium RBG_13_48_7]|uniref:mRNA-degrading endonuclease n=1 Tax=Candidatus Schekmanbacteria bacterium RBG_13_48_7 TaxID=1817878 RepID=A0A1F7S0Z2_9BACT|nr:MAG: mRNA-degrading endonuclease [Candidatus Schekmanbacteria bacterium RBG_13_48_7]
MHRYIPQKGDFVILTFNPQSGHEQKGRRPAFVVSNNLFNRHTGLAIVCPITNVDKQFPFHVRIHDQSSLRGFIMVEQVKSIDYLSRKIKFVEKAPENILNDVLGILDACIYQQDV